MRVEALPPVARQIEWREVVGSSGKFEVSDRGEVRKAATGSSVTLTVTHRGYLCCGVLHHGQRKIRKVHIMVAEAFIGPRPEGYEVAHIDGDKSNCRVSNLRYDTARRRIQERLKLGPVAPSAKLTRDEVLEIRRKIQSGARFADIAARFEISYGNVKKISQNLTWNHL